MNNFKKQIKEDINEYQEKLEFISNINKDEWAFNYWILDKFFYEDEELIEDKIIDYSDLGVDAYIFYEDTKDLYLIQNKYYSDSTSISTEYIKNDFLLRPINALKNGTYKKSPELQSFFTKYKNHDDFTVYMQIYITNNKRNEEVDQYIKVFNINNPQYRVEIYYLDDIENKYYDEIKQNHSNLTVEIQSVVKGTILNINTSDYKLENVLDARYVFTPVSSIYKIYRSALEKNYPIFDMNIREYLGNKGINKKIYTTLLDKQERKNFFYYNNGITLICDAMTKPKPTNKSSGSNINISFEVQNPQIVNGCQTVNSIYEALKNIDPVNLEKEYKDTFVMLKILEIDRKNESEEELYKKIVTYNNSQNSINEKTFVSNTGIFNRLKTEFENKGFLLLIKQSDKNTYGVKYKNITTLLEKSNERIKKFELNKSYTKTSDFFIPLEKLLQVIIAFCSSGHQAYTKKSYLLKYNSEQYNIAIDFIKNPNVTTETLLDLYTLYKKADVFKINSEDNRYPIPYYLIDGFAKYECEDRDSKNISLLLNDSHRINNILKLYTLVTKRYTSKIKNKLDIEYNMMIKKPIDYNILSEERDTVNEVIFQEKILN